VAQEQFANNPSSTLAGAIAAGATSLTVASAASFSTEGTFRILVDSEIMLVTGVAGATFTVERGAEGTSAAAHSAGATVTQVLTAGALNTALYEDVRIKTAAAVHKSGDLVPVLAQTVALTDTHLNSIAFDGHTLITGTYPGGAVWVSNDRGLTWASVGQPNSDASVDDIAFVKAIRPGVFYAGCSNSGGPSKLYKSTDSGATWSLVYTAPGAADATEGFSVEGIGRLVLIGSFNNTAAGAAKIYKSSDGGSTFAQVSATGAGRTTIRQIRHVYENIYIAGVYGATPNQLDLYRSSDVGSTWTSVQSIASTDAYTCLALPNGTVLLGTHPSGKVYRSTDYAQTFTEVADLGLGPGQSQVFGLTQVGQTTLAFVNRNTSAEVKVYASDDAFDTWVEVAELDNDYHYHEPVLVDWRTIIAPAAHNSGGRGAIFRMTWYG